VNLTLFANISVAVLIDYLYMKKWLIGLFVLAFILGGALYVFIPKEIKLTSGIAVSATGSGIHRMLLDKTNLTKWWPGEINDGGFRLNNYSYEFDNNNMTLMRVSINGQSNSLISSLFLISVATDSTQLEWTGSVVTSSNPIRRFFDYLEAKKINRDMGTILNKMKLFYSKPENIYGLDIRKSLVTDSFLISTSGLSKGYPTNQFIYGLIDQLKNFVVRQSAKETGYPMLHIATTDSIDYEVRVAIPTDKLLESSGSIQQRQMLGRGNILVGEVTGGVEKTSHAFRQMQLFMEDYKHKPPAIPFYSLITDRLKEPDSSKWVTRIYFPVM